MIPCHICGRHAENRWVIGFPPAPDSEKMGLCHLHDTPKNRVDVQQAWQNLIYAKIGEFNRHEAGKQGDITQLLSIYFTGGGSISIPCAAFTLAEGNTLRITTPGGELVFFPLSQVRNYALTPLEPMAEREALPGTNTLEADDFKC